MLDRILNTPRVYPLQAPPWTQGVNWTYMRRSEDAQGVFWTSYVRSIYVLCPVGYLFQFMSIEAISFIKKTS